ncbi:MULTISPECIES: DUF4186 family protein [unclassified Streptomyces]|nr:MULTISPECIES: DUF4186 family protein [unclassified Streptomyces]
MAMAQDGLALPRLTSFSTRRAPQGDEVDYWRQASQKAYVSARTDPVGNAFDGEIRLGQYTDFRLSTKRARPEEVRRSAGDIAQGREDDDYLYLVFQLSGDFLVEQAGRQTLATPGSLVIYDSAAPFSLSAKEEYEQVVLELPADRAFAQAGVSRSNDLLARTFDCGGAMGAVAAFFVNLAQRQDGDRLGAHLLEPQATALGTSLLGLIAPGRCQVPEALRRGQAAAYMRAHLADPDLDAEGIAAGLHVSRRTLFRLFEGTGESAMARLRSLRLERARVMLRTQPGKRISAIAQETGFSSSVQFYRAFRAVAGMTPSEYREADFVEGPDTSGRPGAGDMTSAGASAGGERTSGAMEQDRLDAVLERIARIPFRAKFHLRPAEREYVALRGMVAVRRHARELIDSRLAPACPVRDGRQTPWGGHPVFRAQHATATCCRTCLQINHGIAKGRELSEQERERVVGLICLWIERECRAGPRRLPDPPATLF